MSTYNYNETIIAIKKYIKEEGFFPKYKYIIENSNGEVKNYKAIDVFFNKCPKIKNLEQNYKDPKQNAILIMFAKQYVLDKPILKKIKIDYPKAYGVLNHYYLKPANKCLQDFKNDFNID